MYRSVRPWSGRRAWFTNWGSEIGRRPINDVRGRALLVWLSCSRLIGRSERPELNAIAWIAVRVRRGQVSLAGNVPFKRNGMSGALPAVEIVMTRRTWGMLVALSVLW